MVRHVRISRKTAEKLVRNRFTVGSYTTKQSEVDYHLRMLRRMGPGILLHTGARLVYRRQGVAGQYWVLGYVENGSDVTRLGL